MLDFWFAFLVVLLVYLQRAEKVIHLHSKHRAHSTRGQKTTLVCLNIANSVIVSELTTMSRGVFVWLWILFVEMKMSVYYIL